MFDVRRVLENPQIYQLFQKMVGAEKARKHFIEAYIIPRAKGGRVLEVGCGPANNLVFLPDDIAYVGCDPSAAYITYAQKRYGTRGRFFVGSVAELSPSDLGTFYVIMVVAVLHHLSDEESAALCKHVTAMLKPGGCFITGDPCFTKEQSFIEHTITACDRGKFVRYPEAYKALLSPYFATVSQIIVKGGLLIPNTGTIMIAS
jgi:SAM-dependent methyltransferase